MKKLILLLAVSLPLLVAGNVGATSIFTLTQGDLLAIDNTPVIGGSAIGTLTITDMGSLVVGFSQAIDDDPTNQGYWAAQYLGYSDTSGLSFGSDLSAYDEYTLDIQNVNKDIWAVNLFIETTTDYAEGTLAWLNPTGTAHLTLNLGTISGLNNVTNIGFIVGSNFVGDPGHPAENPSYPRDLVAYHIQVETYDPIPEPTSLVLLGSGLLGLAFARKKRKR